MSCKSCKQVTRGHNIFADGWAGAVIPHLHPTPYPKPFPTRTQAQKASKALVFLLLDSCSQTDGRTEVTLGISIRVFCFKVFLRG